MINTLLNLIIYREELVYTPKSTPKNKSPKVLSTRLVTKIKQQPNNNKVTAKNS